MHFDARSIQMKFPVVLTSETSLEMFNLRWANGQGTQIPFLRSGEGQNYYSLNSARLHNRIMNEPWRAALLYHNLLL